MAFSVVPVWIVEDDKGNQYGVCYSNEEANRIRSALVKAAELQSSEQPQSSEGDSTETMVEPAAVSDEDVKWAESEIAKEAAADFDEFSRSAWSHPATAARANGSAEQTE